MIVDLLIVAVTIAILTVLTANRNNVFTHLKQNSITAGMLFTVIQLMIFISRLSSAGIETHDFYNLIVSVLVRFRPLLIGVLFRIIFGIGEGIQKRNKKTDIVGKGEVENLKLDFALLSRREIEVARLAAKGYTNAQIAECLYISTETVKSHMNSIFEKLKITSRKELMDFVI